MNFTRLKLTLFKNILTFSTVILVFFSFSGCIKLSKSSTRDVPVNAQERAKKNVEEGRGMSLKNLTRGRGGTTYEFSTSNPMWRASLEVLDFLPLSNVDYSGGVIITDWYKDATSKSDEIKITLRFLSNEIRTDSLKIIIHQKNCINNNCSIVLLNDSKINSQLLTEIIRKAAALEKKIKEKKITIKSNGKI